MALRDNIAVNQGKKRDITWTVGKKGNVALVAGKTRPLDARAFARLRGADDDDQSWSRSHRMILALVVTVSNRPYAKKQKVPQEQFITNA